MSSRLIPLRVTRRLQQFQGSLLDTPVQSSEKTIFKSEEAFPETLDTFLLLSHWPESGHMLIPEPTTGKGMGLPASYGMARLCPERRLAFLFPDLVERARYHLRCPYNRGLEEPVAFSLFYTCFFSSPSELHWK